jgi:hypothetical protein
MMRRTFHPLACVALAVAGCQEPLPPQPTGVSAQQLADMEVVKSYSGRALDRFLDSHEDRPLDEALARLAGRPAAAHPFDLSAAYVWRFTRGDEPPSFLVLERDWLISIPGTTRMRLTLLSRSGDTLAASEFDAGGRTHLDIAELTTFEGIEYPVIYARMHSWFGTLSRQYYACVGGQFALIRVEGKNLAASRNPLFKNSGPVGPLPPAQSAEKWEADLNSPDRALVLRALVWLGAVHGTGPRETPAYGEGASAPSVRARPTVAARLRSLAAVGPEWEREMAELALNPEDY